MIATNKRYGFAFTDGTGYATRTIIYDAALLYSPPPYFPLAADITRSFRGKSLSNQAWYTFDL